MIRHACSCTPWSDWLEITCSLAEARDDITPLCYPTIIKRQSWRSQSNCTCAVILVISPTAMRPHAQCYQDRHWRSHNF